MNKYGQGARQTVSGMRHGTRIRLQGVGEEDESGSQERRRRIRDQGRGSNLNHWERSGGPLVEPNPALRKRSSRWRP